MTYLKKSVKIADWFLVGEKNGKKSGMKLNIVQRNVVIVK
jgi:hypothetical protein